MAGLGKIDELINKIGTKQGIGFSFAEGPKPALFDAVGGAAKGVRQAAASVTQPVTEAVKPVQDIGKKLSKGIASTIEAGINTIFDAGLTPEDKQIREQLGVATPSENIRDVFSGTVAPLPDRPQVQAEIPQALPLAPEDQQAQTQRPAATRNRFAELVEQQRNLRNQLRGRRS